MGAVLKGVGAAVHRRRPGKGLTGGNGKTDPFLADLWRRAAGLPPSDEEMPPLSELRRTEWSEEFEQLMRNRLVMGAFRYGRLGAPGKPQYDRIAGARRRLELYERTGNLEHLVDVANVMLCEFVEGRHPKRHLRASDDGPHHEERVRH